MQYPLPLNSKKIIKSKHKTDQVGKCLSIKCGLAKAKLQMAVRKQIWLELYGCN